MTTPATFTIDETPRPRGRSIIAKCDLCGWVTFGWLPHGIDADRLTRDHYDQHKPDRALDIEVEWLVRADCSVCEIDGNVSVDDEGDLTCEKCGTCWSIDGKGGTRDEERA